MLTDREGLLRSATLLALEAVRGTDEEVALTVRTAVGEDRFCDTLEALSNKYAGSRVAALSTVLDATIRVATGGKTDG